MENMPLIEVNLLDILSNHLLALLCKKPEPYGYSRADFANSVSETVPAASIREMVNLTDRHDTMLVESIETRS